MEKMQRPWKEVGRDFGELVEGGGGEMRRQPGKKLAPPLSPPPAMQDSLLMRPVMIYSVSPLT